VQDLDDQIDEINARRDALPTAGQGGIASQSNRRDLAAQAAELQAQRDRLVRNQELAPQQFQGSSAIGQAPSAPGETELAQINPLVSFLRDQGFEDIQESAAARGRLRSGGTLEDLTEFNTNLAATVAPHLQQQRFNQLFSVLGLGQNAAVGQGSAALSTSANIANLLGAQGQAQAAGALGRGQAINQGISGLAGAFGAQQAGLFNPNQGTTGGVINTGTQVDPLTGAVSSPIPQAGTSTPVGGF
jgi:hypothetical protein